MQLQHNEFYKARQPNNKHIKTKLSNYMDHRIYWRLIWQGRFQLVEISHIVNFTGIL